MPHLYKTLMMSCLAALLLGSLGAQAKIEAHRFESPEREALYQQMIAELRCLVCQNQNLADSNAELAKDLRDKTYNMVSGGKSRGEIVDYMTQRYGDFVLYRPPLKASTILLWAGPFVFLLIALFIGIRIVRKRNLTLADDMPAALETAEDLLKNTDQ